MLTSRLGSERPQLRVDRASRRATSSSSSAPATRSTSIARRASSVSSRPAPWPRPRPPTGAAVPGRPPHAGARAPTRQQGQPDADRERERRRGRRTRAVRPPGATAAGRSAPAATSPRASRRIGCGGSGLGSGIGTGLRQQRRRRRRRAATARPPAPSRRGHPPDPGNDGRGEAPAGVRGQPVDGVGRVRERGQRARPGPRGRRGGAARGRARPSASTSSADAVSRAAVRQCAQLDPVPAEQQPPDGHAAPHGAPARRRRSGPSVVRQARRQRGRRRTAAGCESDTAVCDRERRATDRGATNARAGRLTESSERSRSLRLPVHLGGSARGLRSAANPLVRRRCPDGVDRGG